MNKSSRHGHKPEPNDTIQAVYGVRSSVIKAVLGHTLRVNTRAVPPSGSKVKVAGGSVIPANGRPNLPGDMASTLVGWAFVTGAANKRTAVELGGARIFK